MGRYRPANCRQLRVSGPDLRTVWDPYCGLVELQGSFNGTLSKSDGADYHRL